MHENADFLSILSESDRGEYEKLKQIIQSAPQNFSNMTELLSVIKNYCIRGDGGDGQRCFAVGICWLRDGALGININHLSLLTGFNKNVLNASFSNSNFLPSSFSSELVEKIPSLAGNTKDLRMWCVRKLHTQTPKPNLHDMKATMGAAPSSPNPQFPSTHIENKWSYEDYLESYGRSDSASAQANFWDDPFSIPLGSLQNGLLEGNDICF